MKHPVKPTVVERVRELAPGQKLDRESTRFTYLWDHGYEKLRIEYDGGGSLDYAGSYHPGDGSCKGNPCMYCGKAWPDA